eukprot:39092_1
MFPNPYNFHPQTYQLGYNPWAVQAQAQIRAAQQLQQSQLAYNVQPTLIQQAQSAAALQQLQQQQALTLQALQHNKYLMAAQQQQKYKSVQQRNKQHKNNKNIKHNKNSNNLYPKTCTVCNVVCNSSLQWNMHINGKKHTKQTRGLQYQNSLNNNNSLNNSLNNSSNIITSTSTSHNSSLDNNNNNNNIIKQENMIPSDQYVVEIDGRRKCALCHVEFTSAMCEMSHIKGKRHKMAKRGHPQHFNSKKRKNPDLIALGRCDLCDVDFTSQTQKDSHLTGKKHLKNVRLVDSGQPPKKRQKTNYFSSFKKNIPMQPLQITINNNDGINNFPANILPHQRLQLEVERIYKEYTQIAKSSHPYKA